MTKDLGMRALVALGMVVGLVACNAIAGIHQPTLRGEGGAPAQPCTSVADCTVEEPECRAAACQDGVCSFQDVPDGTALSKQTAGDCVERVCDGAGKVRLAELPTDVPEDDGKVCTVETCDGTVPKHTLKAEVPCYTGDPKTRGVGECKDGVQQCDAEGNVVGACTGEVLPRPETCLEAGDEDCNGKANEGGAGCVCLPGEVEDCYTGPAGTKDVGICHGGKKICDDSGAFFGDCKDEQKPATEVCDSAKRDEDCNGQSNEGMSCTCGDGVVDLGEECDDGNTDETDACTNTCKHAKCGDGFMQPSNGEECDDGNADDSDACRNTCKKASCGDGVVQAIVGEECDDGGQSDADKCSSTCKWQEVLALEAGDMHTCARLSGGVLKCWGNNMGGQLGQGDMFPRGDGSGEMGSALPAVNLGANKTATTFAAGANHTCAILNDGSLECWGDNSRGQLGVGDMANRGDGPNEMGNNLPAVNLGTAMTAKAITAGAYHTCAILNDGSLKCWGDNSSGKLGLGDAQTRGDNAFDMGDILPRVDLGTGKTVTAISAGADHTCAILSDGSVKCWGDNSQGQLGLGDTVNRGVAPNQMGNALPAVALGTGKTATAISAGGQHTCVILNDGSVKCWGYNFYGALGLGDAVNRGIAPSEMGDALPTVNLGWGKTAAAISAGREHTCALLTGQSVKCWGYNNDGRLGLGDMATRGDGQGEMGDLLPAISLGTGKTATAIRAGGDFTCALLNDSSAKCWGNSAIGELGLGDTSTRGDNSGEMGDNLPSVKLFSSAW